MSQRRINVFGDLIDTADLPEMIANIMAPGRLIGNDFIVAATDLMQISPGSCLLPDGVLVLEDEVKNLVVPISSLATDYTVVYQLEDTSTLGGSPAILRLLSGTTRQENMLDGTILGWLRYPGGSVPLSTSFFVQPSHLRIQTRTDIFNYLNSCPLKTIKGTTNVLTVTSTDVDFIANTFYKNSETLSNGSAVTLTTTGTLPAPLALATTYYVINSVSNTFQLATTPIGFPIDLTTGGSGFHTFTVVTSPWAETTDYVLHEVCSRYANTSGVASTYILRLPFTVTSAGQPRKLVTRLLVDFNCLVTFALNLRGTSVTLSPNGGLISNTGTIITREFDISTNSSLIWEAGSTAYIEITIDSQPSRGTSIAYVGLTLEPTPFTLFT